MSAWSDPNAVLLDATLWNLPRLQRNATPPVTRFIDAFSRRLDPDSIVDPVEPLDLAALGVAAETYGQRERAVRVYESLAQSDGDAGLLGKFLLAWSATSQDPHALAAPLRAIEGIENDPLLQARLTCKLIAAAYAHQWDEAIPGLFTQAQAWAPPGTMVAAMLKVEAYNLLGSQWPSDWAFEPDELTGYEWIRERAWGATTKSMLQQVTQRAQSPWTITIGAGVSEAQDVIAAFMQMEWAGAIWLRREISQQLAAHLLLDDAAQPQQAASAVSLWTLSATAVLNADGVVELAEPRFDGQSADQIIGQLDRGASLRHATDHALTEMSVALWDLLTEGTVSALLDRVPLVVSDHPHASKAAVFWAVASLRTPDAWHDHFARLDSSQRRQLLVGLSPAVAKRLPQSVANELVEASTERPEQLHEAHILGVLVDRADRIRALDLSSAPPAAIALIARDAPSIVDGALLDRSIHELVDECRSVVKAARQGRRGLGSYEPFAILSVALVASGGDLLASSVEVLEEAARDPEVPADVRYQALRGLTAVAHNKGLPSDAVDRLRDIPESGAAAIFEFVTPRLVHAARIALLIVVGQEGWEAELLMLVRDEQPRVRQLAVETVALALQRTPSAALEGALAGALFDPDEGTVTEAVRSLTANPLRASAVRLAIGSRLVTLFDRGGRGVRTAVIRAIQAGVMPDEQQTQAERLLARAREDRSFEVRDLVSGVE